MPNERYTVLVSSKFQKTAESEKGVRALALFFIQCGIYQDQLALGRTNADRNLIRDWRESMGWIEEGYICSGRRVLLEFLIHQIRLAPDHTIQALRLEDNMIVYSPSKNENYAFSAELPVNAESAANMTKQEAVKWCQAIRDVGASFPFGESKEYDNILPIIKKAFGINASRRLLTKQELFLLGHFCRFDAESMAKLLSRYMQDGIDGEGNENAHVFFSKNARDLVELYTFLFPSETENPAAQAERIYQRYLKMRKDVPNAGPEKPAAESITELTIHEMNEMMTAKTYSEETLLKMLSDYAPYLDQPSASHHDLYQLLVQTALRVLQFEGKIEAGKFQDMPLLDHVPDGKLSETTKKLIFGDDFDERNLQEPIKSEKLWLQKRQFKSAALEIASDLINRDNVDVKTGKEERFQIYGDRLISSIGPTKQGTAMVKPLGTERIEELLNRETNVRKNDVLFMLFYIIGLVSRKRAEEIEAASKTGQTSAHRMSWKENLFSQNSCLNQLENINRNRSTKEKRAIYALLVDMLDAFTSVSELLLSIRNLGMFYVPHFSEYSFLSAIVASAISGYSISPMNWFLLFASSKEQAAKVYQFNEPEALYNPDAPEPTPTNLRIVRKNAKNEQQEPEPVRIVFRKSEAQRTCRCGGRFECAGRREIGEEWDITHEGLRRRTYFAENYVCDSCGAQAASGPEMKPLTNDCIASDLTIANIMVRKYDKVVPQSLQSQEKSLRNQNGYIVHADTMAKWLVTAADVWLRPIWEKLRRELLCQPTILVSACAVVKLDRTGEDTMKDCRVFAFAAAKGRAIRLIEVANDGKSALLNGYDGVITADDSVRRSDLPVASDQVFYGWDEMRARWDRAAGSEQNDVIMSKHAEWAKATISKLLSLARTILKAKAEPGKQSEIRAELETLASEYWSWVDALHKEAKRAEEKANAHASAHKKKRAEAEAVEYALAHKEELNRCLASDIAHTSNEPAAKMLKSFQAENSWQVLDGKSTDTGVILFSIIQTAKANRLDPCSYLRYLLWQLRTSEHPDLDRLMPFAEVREAVDAFVLLQADASEDVYVIYEENKNGQTTSKRNKIALRQ